MFFSETVKYYYIMMIFKIKQWLKTSHVSILLYTPQIINSCVSESAAAQTVADSPPLRSQLNHQL